MTDDPDLRWPSGQRRRHLPSNLNFDAAQLRAAMAMLDLTAQDLANKANAWPYSGPAPGQGMGIVPDHVEALSRGRAIDADKREAICWTLYDEGFGVVVVAEASAGGGVRFAKTEAKRAEGTFGTRRRRQEDQHWRDAAAARGLDLSLQRLNQRTAEACREAERLEGFTTRTHVVHGPPGSALGADNRTIAFSFHRPRRAP